MFRIIHTKLQTESVLNCPLNLEGHFEAVFLGAPN